MKITADTNILVRAIMEDDPAQAKAARNVLKMAELVALPMPALCELSWVLGGGYRLTKEQIARALGELTSAHNVAVDETAVEAGMAMLEAGGDFADGVIAHAGRWMGSETFASFDKKAVKLLKRQGQDALIPH